MEIKKLDSNLILEFEQNIERNFIKFKLKLFYKFNNKLLAHLNND